MQQTALKKIILAAIFAVAVWAGYRFVLPIMLPFLLGGLLALAAEPVVAFGVRRLRLKRSLSAGLGVTMTMVMLSAVISLVGAVAVKEVGNLARSLPNLEKGTQTLQDWLISAADKAPEGVRNIAQRTVLEVFDDGTAVVEQISRRVPNVLTSVISGVGSSVLGVGTGILAAFFISARLPRLKQSLAQKLPESWKEKYLPALKRIYRNLGGWLKAQGKLALVTWGIVSVGLLVLRLPFAPAWAALVALVDAIPILGTGTVLVPWALVNFIQGDSLGAVILLSTYAAAAITRTVLEPRLVGRQLGLDPLMTLFVIYIGYRFWGFLGLVLAPIAASAIKSVVSPQT